MSQFLKSFSLSSSLYIWASPVAQWKRIRLWCRRLRFNPSWEDPLEEEGMATHSNILVWRIPWQGSLAGYSHSVTESDTTEATVCVYVYIFYICMYACTGFPGDTVVQDACGSGYLGQEEPLEKEMATYSSLLVWRIFMDRGTWWATAHRVTKS